MSDTKDTGWTGGQQAFGAFAPGLVHYTDRVLFDEVWERDGLSKRDRSLVTVAALTAMGKTEQLQFHLDFARRNGVTEDEVKEAILHRPARPVRGLAGRSMSGCGRRHRLGRGAGPAGGRPRRDPVPARTGPAGDRGGTDTGAPAPAQCRRVDRAGGSRCVGGQAGPSRLAGRGRRCPGPARPARR